MPTPPTPRPEVATRSTSTRRRPHRGSRPPTTSRDDEHADAGGEGDQVGGVTEVEEGRVVEGGSIVYGIDTDGTGFNTLDAITPGSIRMIVPVVESLTQILANGDWAPLLAEDLTPNDDFTVWTIHLREGVVFPTAHRSTRRR